jgi:hypothetical protein
MRTLTLPWKLALVGVAMGLVLMGAWAYIDSHDPFHLPTVGQAAEMQNFATPPLYHFLQTLTLVLYPGLWLQAFTIHAGPVANYTVWIFSLALDGVILYWVGLLVTRLRIRLQRRRSRSVDAHRRE